MSSITAPSGHQECRATRNCLCISILSRNSKASLINKDRKLVFINEAMHDRIVLLATEFGTISFAWDCCCIFPGSFHFINVQSTAGIEVENLNCSSMSNTIHFKDDLVSSSRNIRSNKYTNSQFLFCSLCFLTFWQCFST